MNSLPTYSFRLYIAGDAPNSAEALDNLTAICRASLPDRHSIEVVDVFKEPMRARADRVFMTPSLLKLSPSPTRRIVGTLSRTDIVMLALGLNALTA